MGNEEIKVGTKFKDPTASIKELDKKYGKGKTTVNRSQEQHGEIHYETIWSDGSRYSKHVTTYTGGKSVECILIQPNGIWYSSFEDEKGKRPLSIDNFERRQSAHDKNGNGIVDSNELH